LEHYAPKKEISFSLGTKDLNEALEKVHVEAVKLDQEFASARRRAREQPTTEISDVEIERLGALQLHSLLKEDEEARFEGDPGGDEVYRKTREDLIRRGVEFLGQTTEQSTARFGMSERALGQMRFVDHLVFPKMREAMAKGDLSVVEEETNELLDENGYSIEVGSELWRRVAIEILKAWVQAGELIEMRYAGDVVETPLAPANVINRNEHDTDGDSPALSELWKLYLDERQLKTKTASDFATQVRRFIEVNGDLPIGQVKPEHVRAFKDALLKMPARPSGDLKGKTVPEIVRALEGRNDIKRLSARTINDKALGAVSAIFGYAFDNGYRNDNPAQRIKASGPKATGPSRIAYSIDDLKIIFSNPVFVAGVRPKGGGGEAAKWLPLLALFTGARMEELGRLDVADIGEEEGVDYLFIHSGAQGEKSLKTESSRRKVPIHPELIRLGFHEYVVERRTMEGTVGRLFPDLTSNLTEVTAGYSKWWGRDIRGQGITDPRKVFHSFRHLVKRQLRDSGVEKTVRDALVGHAATDVAELYGRDEEGLGISLPTLYDALVKLDYRGLDLSHLYCV
jgi:integrase